MLQTVLDKPWKQHPIKLQLYSHLPPISKTILVRRIRDIAGESRTKSSVMFFFGLLHMDVPVLDDPEEEYLQQLYAKYTGPGKYETLTTLRCSGTKRLVFRHEERETQFLLC